MATIRIKRVYEPIEPEDGFRVLVDRLWPRGVSKEKAKIDLWARDVAPSTELRRWFGHDPAKWDEFRKCYEKELAASAALDELRATIRPHKRMTLLYSARSTELNQAVVLRDFLRAPRRATGTAAKK